MYDIITVIFFIAGFFADGFERKAIAWAISGLFAIAASICSLIQTINSAKNKK